MRNNLVLSNSQSQYMPDSSIINDVTFVIPACLEGAVMALRNIMDSPKKVPWQSMLSSFTSSEINWSLRSPTSFLTSSTSSLLSLLPSKINLNPIQSYFLFVYFLHPILRLCCSCPPSAVRWVCPTASWRASLAWARWCIARRPPASPSLRSTLKTRAPSQSSLMPSGPTTMRELMRFVSVYPPLF